jgi:putative flippase GtrA
MTRWLRFVRFNLVGSVGIGVQLAALWILTAIVHVHYLPATCIAVGLAVAHNYVWHLRWTWRERVQGAHPMALFARFAAANGAVSLAGNVAVMGALVSIVHVTPVAANALAIAVTGVANFWVGDAVVFGQRGGQVVLASGAGADSVRARCS